MQRAGAGIRSLAEPYLDTTFDFAEIIFAILGVAAKLERRRILERTAHGRDDAKANGVKFGRKPILTHTSKKRPASASKRARRSAASPAATTSVRVRFRDSQCDDDFGFSRKEVAMERTAECHCPSLKVIVAGEPERVYLCHCKACQRRTGAIVHSGATHLKGQVRIENEHKVYAGLADSGYEIRFHSCPNCGSNVFFETDKIPHLYGIMIGCLADPTFP